MLLSAPLGIKRQLTAADFACPPTVRHRNWVRYASDSRRRRSDENGSTEIGYGHRRSVKQDKSTVNDLNRGSNVTTMSLTSVNVSDYNVTSSSSSSSSESIIASIVHVAETAIIALVSSGIILSNIVNLIVLLSANYYDNNNNNNYYYYWLSCCLPAPRCRGQLDFFSSTSASQTFL